jgi:uncharacterized membrane protein
MGLLITGLIIFFGLHSVAIVAPAWREQRVRSMGVNAWKALYSVLSGIGFALILIGYGHARLNAATWYVPPVVLRHVTFLLMLPVFPLLLAAYLPGRLQARAKHPMLAAVKFWATAHLLAIGTAPDVLLFGSFLTWAVVDRISLKRRAGGPVPPRIMIAHADLIAIAGGLALYALTIFKLHALVIGVSPLAAQ